MSGQEKTKMEQPLPEENLSEEEIKFPYELTELDTLGGIPPNFT